MENIIKNNTKLYKLEILFKIVLFILKTGTSEIFQI